MLATVRVPGSQFATIVMPALNEAGYIAEAVASLLPDESAIDYELLVLDGGSSDGTPEIVAKLSAANPRIRLVHNPRRIQSAAVNIAAETCDPRTTVLVRADCHAVYPPRFVEKCVETLIREQSSSVVVSMRAIGRTPLQNAIAATQNSRLGNGGSAHRRASRSGFVDHGHHAAFDLGTFRSLGGYDESAPYNEDAEFDARLIGAGGRIFLDGNLSIDYYPRSSLPALAKQYFRHGWGRANTLLKHGMRPKLRQILPVLLLLGCLASIFSWPLTRWFSLLLPTAYVVACVLWGALLAVRQGEPNLLWMGPAAVTMHMSWALGFLDRACRTGATRFLRLRNRSA